MSNHITFGEDCLKMSNGLTAVFIDVLTLAGSRLAQSDDEKRLVVRLAEKDQSAVGMGTVGFDIREMPWSVECFEDNKRFMLKVIETAERKTAWEKLDYSPNEKLLIPALKKLAEMISKMTAADADENATRDWLDAAEPDDPILRGFPICKKHGALMTCFGCHICNN